MHGCKDVGCVGELRRGTFGKLLEMLVELVVIYGAECVEFWYRVMKLGDERLVKHVAVEACKQREMKWMKDLRQGI